ncbi:NUDIX domain-containing protein [Nocardioides sp. CER19]|uniref:NUDIX hydrolase n=1 Tax=Nocardioides sp. CER19 TaxID=3038538 RepID=UPI00244BA8DA|nr:NUDIX domain-containing protein [Nocardioides sp. CER19]MDH2412875.1 NUDIX domain-containing protein [Nocardioides sp. CER19]
MSTDSGSARTLVPVPPAERPFRTRRTVRVLLVDDRDRLLLFRDSDPGIPGSRWWITPGGGVDPGETDLETAVRELEEESGLRVSADQLLGPLLVRRVWHGYTDVVIDQEDAFYACWVPAFEVSDAGHTEEERTTMTAHHWWSRPELAGTDEDIWPAVLTDLWAEADVRRQQGEAGDASRPPLDGGEVEESTVPVAAGYRDR